MFAVAFPTYLYTDSAYLYLSWSLEAISVVAGFMAIYEAFLDLFQPFHTLRDLGIMLFKWAGLLMLLVAGVIAVFTRSPDTSAWGHAIIAAVSSLRCAQAGMALFLLISARYVGVSRKQQSFGVALGFAIVAVVELVLVTLHGWLSSER